MSCNSSIYDDCCLLTNIDLNFQRISQLLEHRFKNNSNKTSFDFKSLSPEQPSNNTKVSRSLLRFQPKLKYIHDYEDNISSNSSSSEEEDQEEVVSTDDDDDYLNKLAEWDPANFQPMIETDDEDEDEDDDENENIFQTVNTTNNNKDNQPEPMEHSSAEDTPTTPVEDVLITFIHRPLKSEPINYDDNPPQLDGQMDFVSGKSSSSTSCQSNSTDTNKRLDETVAKIRARNPQQNKTIQIHQIPSIKTKFRLNDDRTKKPTTPILKKRPSISKKIERIIQPTRKLKNNKPLLFNVLKISDGAIRPLHTPIPTTPTNIQKTFRLPSDSRLTMTNPKPKKTLSNEERISSFINKQRSLQQNLILSKQAKEKSASHHMTLAEKKLTHFQKHQLSKSSNINPIPLSTIPKPKETIKVPPKPSKSLDSALQKIPSIPKTPLLNNDNQQIKKKMKKKLKQTPTIDNLISKPKIQKPIEKLVTTITQPLIIQRSESSIEVPDSPSVTSKRPANFFEGCIEIDDDDDNTEEDNNHDDDIQEIERQPYSIACNIRTREKLLDHAVHSSVMHIKWLLNLEYVLLQHIIICHENNIRPLNENFVQIKNEFSLNSIDYQIDPSFISIIIINFLKMFILKNCSNDQQEVSFLQFGLTSHLRYLLIELPTYNHNEEKDSIDNNCLKCHQYSLIINILFDLLFDLIEYDICEMNTKLKYRSSLIEEDYFTRFLQSNSIEKSNRFYRIKLIIYFIELIGIHMNKCQKKKQFQFNKNENKLFHSLEDFIQHILSNINNSVNQRISICFNAMELCLLFVNEKEIRIKQMAMFLSELCENNITYLNLFLFDKNLFTDIRLLLINQLISKKFSIKFYSIDQIKQFFDQIQESFNSQNSIDEFVLLLLRSLFNTYADLIIEIKIFPLMYSNYIQELTVILRNQLELVFGNLLKISDKNPEYFEEIKRTLILFRLLKCKWNKL